MRKACRKPFDASLVLAAALVTILGLTGLAVAQSALPQKQMLSVNGQPDPAAVVQISGRSYVDLETLARITGGSLTIKGNQIILTLPAPTTASPPAPANTGLSKAFLTAAIEETAAIREWRSGIATAIRSSYPVADSWVSGFENQAAQGIQFASLAATSPSDRAAFQMLTNAFNKMQTWSNQVLNAHKKLDFLSPEAMNKDPLFQQILTCARALASIYASGVLQDDGSCR